MGLAAQFHPHMSTYEQRVIPPPHLTTALHADPDAQPECEISENEKKRLESPPYPCRTNHSSEEPTEKKEQRIPPLYMHSACGQLGGYMVAGGLSIRV